MSVAAASAASGDRPPRLRADGLSRRFGTRVALDGVSFTVAPGELFGLLGPNGAGKTTAFRLLAGLLPAHAGTLALDGHAVSTDDTAYRARLGVVFQEASLDLKLTARENLRLGAALYGVPRALAARRIDEALALMALGDRADEPASTYSGGMRRRIEIARVLLHEPRLLLMDDVARYKWNHALPVVDPEREDALLERATGDAVAIGLSEAYARRVIAAQIDASRAIQLELVSGWQRDKQPPFADVPDLATVQRPAIDAATHRLLERLHATMCTLSDESTRADLQNPPASLARQHAAWSIAIAALWPVPGDACGH